MRYNHFIALCQNLSERMPMSQKSSPLQTIEPRLRPLLPESLYIAAWVDSESSQVLMTVADHLRALYRTLYASVPLLVAERNLEPGAWYAKWVNGTLMFAELGNLPQDDADALKKALNPLWDALRSLIGEAGGQVQWFTGSAFLVFFEENAYDKHIEQAVRGAIRMMHTQKGEITLKLALHNGRVLTSHIGTPQRMAYLMAGSALQTLAQVASSVSMGDVGMSESVWDVVRKTYRPQRRQNGITILQLPPKQAERVDDFEISAFRSRRSTSHLLTDLSTAGMVQAITDSLNQTDPLAAYLPRKLVDKLVQDPTKTLLQPQKREVLMLSLRVENLLAAFVPKSDYIPENWLKTAAQMFTRVFSGIEAANGVILRYGNLVRKDVQFVAAFNVLDAEDSTSADDVAGLALTLRDVIGGLYAPRPLSNPDDSTLVKIDQNRPKMTEVTDEQTPMLRARLALNLRPVLLLELGQPRSRRDWVLHPVNAADAITPQLDADIVMNGPFAAALSGAYAYAALKQADDTTAANAGAAPQGAQLLQGRTAANRSATRKNIDIRLY